MTEVTNVKNAEGLSGSDKMEMNIRKIDEGKALIAELNASMTTKFISRLIDIPVTKEEIEYMQANWKPVKDQIRLINSFYASYYGNYRDTNLLTADNFYENAIRLKKKLLMDFGWDVGDTGVLQTAVLPYVLTGNLEGKMNSRTIRNTKYMAKLDEDIHYLSLCNDDFSLMLEIHPEEIKNIISKFVINRFSYVTPEDPELLGHDIDYSEEKIGSETVLFLATM